MASERIQRRIEQLLDEADEAVARSDWAVVRDRAQNVLRLDPDNADAVAFLAAAEREPVEASPPGAAPASEPAATQVTHSTSFASGRYQVQRFLGEGGKKRVYLAHDTLLDRDVAFALIKTEGLDEAGRARVEREAQAMGRLGDHPNIVTVYDIGDEAGQPYIVSQFMGGGDVEGLIEEADDHHMPLEQALDIAKAVGRGLEDAHAQGIVHRDLKPGNVWLTQDGTAKLGDFGLAVATDRSRLTQGGMMVGTVAYMPPEQATGAEVTPRSDLYSLGAMLYEMVAGRPPFVGDDAVAIIGQHLNTAPVAPTWHNPQCPRPLETLILRLLSKNQTERSQSATEVLATLEAIDLADVAAIHELPVANPLDRLARSTFVGRAQELTQGRAAVDEALSGRVGLLLLTGDQGIGQDPPGRGDGHLRLSARRPGALGHLFPQSGRPCLLALGTGPTHLHPGPGARPPALGAGQWRPRGCQGGVRATGAPARPACPHPRRPRRGAVKPLRCHRLLPAQRQRCTTPCSRPGQPPPRRPAHAAPHAVPLARGRRGSTAHGGHLSGGGDGPSPPRGRGPGRPGPGASLPPSPS